EYYTVANRDPQQRRRTGTVTVAGYPVIVSQSGGGQGCPYAVVNPNSFGLGSLNQAIIDTNDNSVADSIIFTFQGTITPTSPLPAITGSVTIDGTNGSGAPGIELNGINAGASVNGLTISADNCSIKGLVINRFQGNGIQINSNFNTIQNCYIGTDLTGTLDR